MKFLIYPITFKYFKIHFRNTQLQDMGWKLWIMRTHLTYFWHLESYIRELIDDTHKLDRHVNGRPSGSLSFSSFKC